MKEVQRPRLQKTEIQRFFEIIVVSDEIGVSKPHPGFFEHAFHQMQRPPTEKVLVVGDNLEADIKGGNQSGTDTCWYNPKKRTNETGILPNYEISSLEELFTSYHLMFLGCPIFLFTDHVGILPV